MRYGFAFEATMPTKKCALEVKMKRVHGPFLLEIFISKIKRERESKVVIDERTETHTNGVKEK